jgi:hypothetical protein
MPLEDCDAAAVAIAWGPESLTNSADDTPADAAELSMPDATARVTPLASDATDVFTGGRGAVKYISTIAPARRPNVTTNTERERRLLL